MTYFRAFGCVNQRSIALAPCCKFLRQARCRGFDVGSHATLGKTDIVTDLGNRKRQVLRVNAAIDPALTTQLPYAPERDYPSGRFGYTAGFQAPEHGLTPRLTEQALVFQLGMLLAHSWMGFTNTGLGHPRRGLGRLLKRLDRAGAPALAQLVSDCLASNPEDRPEDYEDVLETIKRTSKGVMPAKSLRIWRNLRAPYADRLAEMGLSL